MSDCSVGLGNRDTKEVSINFWPVGLVKKFDIPKYHSIDWMKLKKRSENYSITCHSNFDNNLIENKGFNTKSFH